ncbi:hypothetical protein F5Y06DRAFT_307499 [Hypoxylon sp. FL0890]|nr:hypothetical protein F5Y06DRAFT_307499 [Hypoxylon sp. FL0890]
MTKSTWNSHPTIRNSMKSQSLRISFQRTIRVSDYVDRCDLPPDIGTFPLFKVRDYAQRLPPEMAAKGGLFFPMHQKEAMWIKLSADAPFMIKIYAGGVNVSSGEHHAEGVEARRRRVELRNAGNSLQDYVVVPDQYWLDGITVSPRVARQFVAMPMNQGYSVEAQLTGKELTAPPCLQEYEETIPFRCSPNNSIDNLKKLLEDLTGMPADMQLLGSSGPTLSRDEFHCETDTGLNLIQIQGSTVHMFWRLNDGKVVIRPTISEEIASKGVRMLNGAAFRRVTGRELPPSPIEASTYVDKGLPFLAMYEEPSAVAGDFDVIGRVNKIDQSRGTAQGYEAQADPRTVGLNQYGQQTTTSDGTALSIHDPDALMDPTGTLRPFRTVADLERELEGEPRRTCQG